MLDLLFWFLVSQTMTSLPEMLPGTEIRIVSTDLLTIYAEATVDESQLSFTGLLEPGSEVRVLILQPDAGESESAEASGKALFAHISTQGDDVMIQFPELDGPLSFKKWLYEERNISLIINPSGGTGTGE